MDRVRTQIGVNNLRTYSGQGVTIGVLDSGISKHPDLNGAVYEFADFTGGRKEQYDDYGHGTHVCGIISGSGLESGGIYRGIAPASKLLVGKILDRNGKGEKQDLLRGLNWMLRKQEEYKIRILNISISYSAYAKDMYGKIITDRMIELYQKGVLIVCAAGNAGPYEESIRGIAEKNFILTIGCNDGSYFRNRPNRCETYSGAGNCGKRAKPDLVAPGTEIVSCNAFCEAGEYYTAKSGTSMATAIVSGAAALVFEKYPYFTPAECAEYMKNKALDLHLPFCRQGHGMINLSKINR